MKNVILLTIDTLRKDVLGCYGGDQNLTPFLDSIQSRSIRFSRALSAGSYTQSGFPGILTSSHYLDYGYSKEKKFNPGRVLVSEPLQKQGILTAGFHSNAYLCAYFGWNRGWAHFYDSMEDDVTDKKPYIEAPTINRKVREWLGKQKGSDKRMFIWTHYMDVHEPYVPEKRYVDMIDPSIGLSDDEMFALFKDVLLKRDVSNPETVELLRKLYLAGVRRADDSAKEFFGILEEAGVLQDSIVIITADHGDEFGEHGGLSHDGKMYSELVDVPLIVFDPSLAEGRVVDTVVSTADIPPTVVQEFGVDPVERFEGHSLLPVEAYAGTGVFGEAVDKYGEREKGDEKPVYFYREDDLKIIYWEGKDSWEMYDLSKDPEEKQNIFDSSPKAEEMKQKLTPRIRRWER